MKGILIGAIALSSFLLMDPGGRVQAQESAATQATQPAGPVKIELTVEVVQNQLQQADQDPSLDAATKAKTVEAYKQALIYLQQVADSSARAAEFEKAAQAAAPQLEVLATQPAEPKDVPPPAALADQPLVQLEQELAKAESALADGQKRLAEFEKEPKRRTDRRAEIAQRVGDAKRELAEIEKGLAASPDPQEPSALTLAKRTLRQARQKALNGELAAYDKELASYDATTQLITAQRDLVARLVSQAEKNVKAWQAIVTEGRRAEADRQAREARQALRDQAHAHPLVRELAQENAELVQQRPALTQKIETVTASLKDIKAKLDQWQKDSATVREKVEKAGVTHTIGLLLRKQRAELPRTRELRRHVRTLQTETATVELDLIDVRKQSNRLAQTDAVLEEILTGLDPATEPAGREEVRSALRELLDKKKVYLASLDNDYDTYFDKLFDLQEAERDLIELVDKHTGFIDEHILWLRSHTELGAADARRAWEALRWLTTPARWAEVGQTLGRDLRQHPAPPVISLLLLAALFALHRPCRARLGRIGKEAAHSRAMTFSPTAKAMVLTALLALPWPALLWLLTWRLSVAGDASEFPKAIAEGLRTVAILYLLAEGFRHFCRPHGLADNHLDWSPGGLKLVRRYLPWFMIVVLPLAFIVSAVEWQDNDEWKGSLGRLAFMAALVASSAFAIKALRPGAGVFREYFTHHHGGWLDRLQYVWYLLAAGLPLVLAVLAAVGYYYTAVQLTWRLQATVWFILGLAIVKGLILRWLLLARRKLAIAQAKKRLAEKRMAAAAAGGTTGEDEPTPAGQQTEIDISAMSVQTHQLFVGLFGLALVIGLWLIWVQVLPALGILQRVKPWPSAPIDLAHLALAIVVLVMTVIAGRNIPGFLEITILARLPLQAGERYAITTLCRYVITIIGVIVTCAFLGIGWSKVQWLVAAMTVGLGFGLQEIFANFISGLILLFERPIRVGDTVTVGDISGTVTRIRIRATTVTGWDRKELIIPNKEFVTGQVINWTLSDSILRIVVPVGIAYGSDTDLAESILRRVAREHPLVLTDPAPIILFQRFGESSLDFELRVYIANIDHFLPVRHDLHKAIDREFRKANIEIAFPQRDLHVRSIEQALPTVDEWKQGRS